jgi:predicted nucleic acid-binding Zn ribbon protein
MMLTASRAANSHELDVVAGDSHSNRGQMMVCAQSSKDKRGRGRRGACLTIVDNQDQWMHRLRAQHGLQMLISYFDVMGVNLVRRFCCLVREAYSQA